MNITTTDNALTQKADQLLVSWYQCRDFRVIEAIGNVTKQSLYALEEALSSESGADRYVILDLRQVKLVDSSGLNLLVRTSEQRQSRERRRAPIVLVIPAEQPDRVLRLGGLDKVLEISYGSVESIAGRPLSASCAECVSAESVPIRNSLQ